MLRRNHWIYAFLCVCGLNGAAHATADSVAYMNLGSLRHTYLTGQGTTAAGVVAITHPYAGITASTGRLLPSLLYFGIPPAPGANNGAAANPRVSVLSLEIGGKLAYQDEPHFDTYHQLPVDLNAQIAGKLKPIAGAEPVFVFSTSIHHGS